MSMKTETVLTKELFGSEVRVLSECGYMCATDITQAYKKTLKITK